MAAERTASPCREKIDPKQRARFEPVACMVCGLASVVEFGGPEAMEREGICECGKRQDFRRPVYHDEVLPMPIPKDWIKFPLESWQTLMEHNRLAMQRAAD